MRARTWRESSFVCLLARWLVCSRARSLACMRHKVARGRWPDAAAKRRPPPPTTLQLMVTNEQTTAAATKFSGQRARAANEFLAARVVDSSILPARGGIDRRLNEEQHGAPRAKRTSAARILSAEKRRQLEVSQAGRSQARQLASVHDNRINIWSPCARARNLNGYKEAAKQEQERRKHQAQDRFSRCVPFRFRAPRALASFSDWRQGRMYIICRLRRKNDTRTLFRVLANRTSPAPS